jgi:hypothetical protein
MTRFQALEIETKAARAKWLLERRFPHRICAYLRYSALRIKLENMPLCEAEKEIAAPLRRRKV